MNAAGPASAKPVAATQTVAAVPVGFDWLACWAREMAERTAGAGISRGARAALANGRFVIEEEERERRLHDPEADLWSAVWRALALARDLETFRALLEGEAVPLDRLDPEWVARLGLRGPA
jgi:hypothetical protein